MDKTFKPCNTHYVEMLNPRTPKSECFSAHVTKSDVRVWFVSSMGANALQVTLTLNFGARGLYRIEGVWICRPSRVVLFYFSLSRSLFPSAHLSTCMPSIYLFMYHPHPVIHRSKLHKHHRSTERSSFCRCPEGSQGNWIRMAGSAKVHKPPAESRLDAQTGLEMLGLVGKRTENL